MLFWDSNHNFESSCADKFVAFPSGSLWNDHVKSDAKTTQGQGFDVLDKGITITMKKNDCTLRRYVLTLILFYTKFTASFC